jgi:hypothetical protein
MLSRQAIHNAPRIEGYTKIYSLDDRYLYSKDIIYLLTLAFESLLRRMDVGARRSLDKARKFM